MTMYVASYGGGVQSTAMMVLAAQGKIPHRTMLFCNVGKDSENPLTLEYIEKVAKPYMAEHGLEFHELDRVKRDGTTETLYERLHRAKRSIDIPVYMDNGAPGNRNCTKDFKITVIERWLKANGATKDNPAHVALGISLDEYHRMKDSRVDVQISEWPLIDLRMNRQDCMNLITEAGLPIPPKSSCWFCPFSKKSKWKNMARTEPELFSKAVKLEMMLNERRAELGKDKVWISPALRPLDEAFSDDGQMSMFDDDDATCDIGGYCMS